MAHLELIDISKAFGDVYAVTSMNLAVEAQASSSASSALQVARKTTTLHMIAGFEAPTTGKILLAGGTSPASNPIQRGLGIVFQTYALFPHAGKFPDTSLLASKCARWKAFERERRVKESLGYRSSLRNTKNATPASSRVGNGSAWPWRAPWSSSRPCCFWTNRFRISMRSCGRSCRSSFAPSSNRWESTTIMVTHDQGEALSISDRVMVMERGKATQYDTPLNV